MKEKFYPDQSAQEAEPAPEKHQKKEEPAREEPKEGDLFEARPNTEETATRIATQCKTHRQSLPGKKMCNR